MLATFPLVADPIDPIEADLFNQRMYMGVQISLAGCCRLVIRPTSRACR
jgi:hypothetical protein